MTFTHHIFVDYENVRDIDLDLVATKPVRLTLVMGQQQKTLPLEVVKGLLQHREQVQMVEAGVSGHNALDLVLGYLIGRESATAQGVQFDILSRDKGFDSLIRHLNQNGISAARHETFTSIPVLGVEESARPPVRHTVRPPGRPRSTSTPDERADLVVAYLESQQSDRPKRKKTLVAHIGERFDPPISEAEIEVILDRLARRGLLMIDSAGGVTYTA